MKKLLLMVLSLFTMVTLASTATALAAGFKSFEGHNTIIDASPVNYTYDADGEKITFKKDYNDYLHLYSKKDKADLLSFIPFIDSQVGSVYEVREVHHKKPDMTLYEIISKKDDVSTGYWLIGKLQGKWVTYVSYDSLTNLGFNPKKTHNLSSSIDDNSLIIKTFDKYGHLDFAAQPFWDDSSSWFGITNCTDFYRKAEEKK